MEKHNQPKYILVRGIKAQGQRQAGSCPCAPIYGDDWFKYLDHYLVEPLNHVFDRKGLLAGTAILNNRSSSIKVYVMNSTDRDIEIGKGMPVAMNFCCSGNYIT